MFHNQIDDVPTQTVLRNAAPQDAHGFLIAFPLRTVVKCIGRRFWMTRTRNHTTPSHRLHEPSSKFNASHYVSVRTATAPPGVFSLVAYSLLAMSRIT